MPPVHERAGEPVAIASGDLQLVFVRTGDRIAHFVAPVAARDAVLLTSVEGVPDDHWPLSPPWQELHVERRGGLQVALLVGRAGRGHWSMSVEPSPAEDAFLFDVACRTSGEAGFLGSTYRLSDTVMPLMVGNAICFANTYELRGITGDVDLSGDNRAARIVPPQGEPRSPQTVRWQYRILRNLRAHR